MQIRSTNTTYEYLDPDLQIRRYGHQIRRSFRSFSSFRSVLQQADRRNRKIKSRHKMAEVLPALLPTPTSAPIATLLKKSRTDGKTGRASASRSWIDEKFMILAAASDMTGSERTDGERAGRLLLEMSGGKRKGSGPSDMGGGDRAGRGPSDAGGTERVGRAASEMGGGDHAGIEESRISWSALKRSASRAPSTDRHDKKPKAPIQTEAFAGPAFMSAVRPDPSELPIPYYFLKKKTG
ncbi:hypothetical protein D1007_21164 [Hordeum vulgare]|nr:hypothetical protein D1007_21164 [Hordeum vulgare]